MSRVSLGILAFLVLVAAAMPGLVQAADAVLNPLEAPQVTLAPRSGDHAPGTNVVPPRVAYGCKRIWRCDEQVCEWRRGCWGVYGYMEGPYFSVALARRQWERDAWPTDRGR